MGLFSAIGGLFGSKKRKKAAAAYAEATKFVPYNMALPGANVSFSGNQIYGGLSPEYQAIRDQFLDAAGGIDLGAQGGLAGIGQGFNFNPVAGLNITGAPTSAGMANPASLLGNNQAALGGLAQALGLADGSVPGAANLPTTPFGNFFNQAQNALGRANGLSEREFALPDTQATFGSRLGLLRDLAKADENQFFQRNLDSQFGKGILASSAGQYQSGAALDALNRADLQRQLTAQDFAQQDWANAFARQQLENQTVAGQRNFFGNLAGQLNAAGMQGAGLESQNQQYLTESANSRVMERFARAMNMFGAQQSSTAQDNASALSAYGLDLNRLGLDQAAYGMDLNAQTANANIGLQNNAQLMDALSRSQGLQLQNAGLGQQQQSINAALMQQLFSNAMNMDQLPIQLAQLSGNLASAKSAANAQAYAPMYDAANKSAQAWAALGAGIDGALSGGFSGFSNLFGGGGTGASMFGNAVSNAGYGNISNPFSGLGTVGFNPYAPSIDFRQTTGFNPNAPLMFGG